MTPGWRIIDPVDHIVTWRHAARVLLATTALLGACGSDDDGGWSPVPGAPSLTSALAVWAFSPSDVWVLDGSSTVQRFDGATWSTLATPSTGGLACIYALSTTDVWLCAGTEVLHYDGSTFIASDVTTPTGLDGLTSIWASSPSDVWAVGDDAIVAHFDGTTWTRTIVGSPFKSSIWGSGPRDLYALSTFDLSHYDGIAWSEVDLGAGGGGGDGQIWGTSATDVWVMPGSEHLSHYDGTAWTAVDLDLVGDLAAVWGPAPDDLWAAGSAGAIAHYDGSSWTEVTHQKIGSPYLRQLLAVHGTASDDIWIVGHQLGDSGSTGLIYHRP